MLLLVDVAMALMPRSCLIFISIRKVRQGDGEECQGKICCLRTCYTSAAIHWLSWLLLDRQNKGENYTSDTSIHLIDFI